MPERRPRPAGELLGEFFRQKGMKRSLRRAEAVLLWPRVVGADVARFSAARSVKDGVLHVDVSDSETAMHLTLQRRRFLARFHDTYDMHELKEIRFQVGRVATRDRESTDSRTPANVEAGRAEGQVDGQGGGQVDGQGGGVASGDSPAAADPRAADPRAADPKAVAGLARELDALELPEDVGAAVLRAGRSLLNMRARQRAAGYDECPTCGALHDGLSAPLTPRERTILDKNPAAPELRERELCQGCRRSQHEPRVIAEARRLALTPGDVDPGLSSAERAVAERLASDYLDASLAELLPRAVSQPSLRTQLELVARCRAALAAGKRAADLEDADMLLLDERIARFLGGSWSEEVA